MSSERRVVFICSGNICRSPMAEHIGRRFFVEAGQVAVVSSAGTLGIEDHPAASNARKAMLEIGIDVSSHRSEGVSPRIIADADALVVMSPEHEHDLILMSRYAHEKIVRLWEFTDKPGRLEEVRDPVGQDIEAFRRCRDTLLECLRNWTQQFVDSR